MTQNEILHEFKQMTIRQQLEMLRAALEIIESNFDASQKNRQEDLPVAEVEESSDPLLSLAGKFSTSFSDISGRHDHFIGKSLIDDHA